MISKPIDSRKRSLYTRSAVHWEVFDVTICVSFYNLINKTTAFQIEKCWAEKVHDIFVIEKYFGQNVISSNTSILITTEPCFDAVLSAEGGQTMQ